MQSSLTLWRSAVPWGIIALLLLAATWVSAQSKPIEKTSASSNETEDTGSKRPATVANANLNKIIMTPERQAAALKFAELHHPELYQLLNGLHRAKRPEFQKAVRQLYSDSERLARAKERTPSRYELSLTEWQLDSRLRLLVARMTMTSDDPELNAQLQELLKKRLDTKLELMKLDRERQAARLAKLDDQIQEIESDRDTALEKDLLSIQRSLGIQKRPTKRPSGNSTENVSLPKKPSANIDQ